MRTTLKKELVYGQFTSDTDMSEYTIYRQNKYGYHTDVITINRGDMHLDEFKELCLSFLKSVKPETCTT